MTQATQIWVFSNDSMTNDSPNLPAGKSLQGGKYRITRVLGQGGFGITYLAVQTGLAMKVAIKEFFLKGSCQRDSTTSQIKVPVADNAELVSKCLRKFKAEARKIASLNNDHIVNIIDIFDENGTSYYVMKYLGGGSLADRIKDGPMPEEKALGIVRDISDALAAVHSSGLLHLDIKPANILFDGHDRAVLIDFGVSKYFDSPQDTTSTSTLVGFSRGFAPLEQINAAASALTPATDIYALGATFYNLLVGATPPDASAVMDTGLPEAPEGVSDNSWQTITHSMQPRRKDRPQTVEEFMELLPKEPAPDPIDEATIIVSGRSAKPQKQVSRINRYALFISSALLVGAIVFFGISLFRLRNTGTQNHEQVSTAQIEDLENQVNTLTQSNADLKKQLNTAKSQASSQSQSSSKLQEQVDKLKSENTKLTNKVSTLEKDNASLKKQVDSYKTDAERWRRQMEMNN